jgi:hypothetical protein
MSLDDIVDSVLAGYAARLRTGQSGEDRRHWLRGAIVAALRARDQRSGHIIRALRERISELEREVYELREKGRAA